MYISPAEALRRYDVSKPTLYADMGNGKLSYKIDDREKRKINVAELDRLYEKKRSAANGVETSNVNRPDENTEFNVNYSSHEIESQRQKIEFLEREIRARNEDAERWREAFDKAQSTADKITALLEDKSLGARQTGGHDKQIELLTKLLERQSEEGRAQDEKIAAMEQTLKEVRANNRRVLAEMRQNDNKGFFQRLFGRGRAGEGGQVSLQSSGRRRAPGNNRA